MENMNSDCSSLYIVEREFEGDTGKYWSLVERSSFGADLRKFAARYDELYAKNPTAKFRLIEYTGEVLHEKPFEPSSLQATKKVYYQVEQLIGLQWKPVFAKLEDIDEALKFLDYIRSGISEQQYRLIEHTAQPFSQYEQGGAEYHQVQGCYNP
jgi:hypothetical protein